MALSDWSQELRLLLAAQTKKSRRGVVEVVIVKSPSVVITTVVTSITLVGNRSKRIVEGIEKGDATAMELQRRQMTADDRR